MKNIAESLVNFADPPRHFNFLELPFLTIHFDFQQGHSARVMFPISGCLGGEPISGCLGGVEIKRRGFLFVPGGPRREGAAPAQN